MPTPLIQLWSHAAGIFGAFYSSHTGYIFMAIGASMNSIMITFMKILVDSRGIPTTTVIFVRMVCTTLITAACLLSKPSKEAYFGAPGVRLWLLARGIVGTASFWLLYHCLKYLPMEDQQAIWFTAPIFTGIIAYFWLGESFGLSEWIAGLVSLVGVILVVQPSFIFQFSSDKSSASLARGFGEALIGTVFGAMALVIVRYMGRRADVLTSLLWFGCTASVVMAPMMVMDESRGVVLAQLTFSTIALLAGVALSGTLATFCMNKAVQVENAGKVSLVMYIQLPFIVLLDYAVFGTVMGLLTLAGCVIIILAASFVAVAKNSKAKEEEQPIHSTATAVYVEVSNQLDISDLEKDEKTKEDEEHGREPKKHRMTHQRVASAIPPQIRLSFVHHRSNSRASYDKYQAIPEVSSG